MNLYLHVRTLILLSVPHIKLLIFGVHPSICTDLKNLIQDALGLTSDRVYRWRLLLEEYGPEVMHIKGSHNTVADAISRLDTCPVQEEKTNWMMFTKCWCHSTKQASPEESKTTQQHQLNMVFANRSKDDVIYPLTVKEIALAQERDLVLKKLTKMKKYSTHLVEDTEVLCNDGKMVIPKVLQHRAVSWYHHYLQHPGHTRLEETLHAAMYWKVMRNTI